MIMVLVVVKLHSTDMTFSRYDVQFFHHTTQLQLVQICAVLLTAEVGRMARDIKHEMYALMCSTDYRSWVQSEHGNNTKN